MERTVGILGSFPVTGGAETACARRSGLDEEGALDAFLLPLVPVHSARELAVGLSSLWQSWSGGAAVVVVALSENRRKFVARRRADEPSEVVESAFDPESIPDTDGFLASAAVDPSLPTDGEQPEILRFPTSANAIGGAVLFSRTDRAERGETCDRLCAWSGRLVEQAACLEPRREERRSLDNAKRAALAEFAAGAGHEINNPLATIAGRAQMLLRDESNAGRRQALATIGAQALRVRDMIGDLMLFARPPAPVVERFTINDVVRSTIDRFADAARSSRGQIVVRETGPVEAAADRIQFQLVLGELVRNSLQAIDGVDGGRGREIRVGLARSTINAKSFAVISVTDNGPGLTEKDRSHAFDPFYSGREAGRGLGFGLCKCWRIVTNHGGWIEVDSVPHVATTFRVFWPADQSQAGPVVWMSG